jgi:DNA-binding HxlR family transcriptional regulator
MEATLMARIRSIKPEIWESADFLALSPYGRLAFICLVSNADDAGRLKTNAYHLAHRLPGIRPSVLEGQLLRMEQLGMIVRYAVAGGEDTQRGRSVTMRGRSLTVREQSAVNAVQLRNWAVHQKIDHPSPSRIPEPPEIREAARGAREDSRRSARAPADRKGSERKGSKPGARTREANTDAGNGLKREPVKSRIPDDVDHTRLAEILDFLGRFREPLTGAQRERELAIAVGMARSPAPNDALLPVMERDWRGYAAMHPGEQLASLTFFAESWDVATNAWLKSQQPATSRGGNAMRVGEVLAGGQGGS